MLCPDIPPSELVLGPTANESIVYICMSVRVCWPRQSAQHRLCTVAVGIAGAAPRSTTEAASAKDMLRPAQNGLKPHQRTGSLRPATRTAVKALPLGLHRNPRRPSSQDTARVQAVARNAAAQSVPPGVVDLIAAAQREIDAASASAEQLIRENDFAEDGLDLDFDAFLESDGIAELVAQAQASAGPLPPVQHTPRCKAQARRAHSPAVPPAVTPPRNNRSADSSSAPASPAQAGTPGASARSDDTPAAAAKASGTAAAVTTATAVPEAANGPQFVATGTPAPAPSSTTAAPKDLPKGNPKQKRAHKNADAIRSDSTGIACTMYASEAATAVSNNTQHVASVVQVPNSAQHICTCSLKHLFLSSCDAAATTACLNAIHWTHGPSCASPACCQTHQWHFASVTVTFCMHP